MLVDALLDRVLLGCGQEVDLAGVDVLDQLVRQVQVVEAQEPFTLQHLMVEQTKVAVI